MARYPDVAAVQLEVGRRVRALREKRGLTQTVVAAQLGTSTQRMAFVEAGKGNLQMDTLVRLANALDCGIEELLGDAAKSGAGLKAAPPAAKKAGKKKAAGRR